MSGTSETVQPSGNHITIPMTTLLKPTYAHEFYKLPIEPVQYWKGLGVNIGRCLGEGSFAAAYEGTYDPNAKLPDGKDQYKGQDFAVKVIHIGYHPYVPGAPNKDKIDDQTMNEILFANRTDISHPNIMTFHFTAEFPINAKTICDHIFIFMSKAMFPLQDLLNCLIRLRAQAPINTGLKWITGIYSAVQYLHNQNVVHNDLHSYNIFAFGDSHQQIGNDFRFKNIELKIADFGKCSDISKESEESKSNKKSYDIERISLMFISLCDRIAFPEDVRKKNVDQLNQVYQKKVSIDDLLKAESFKLSTEADEWTIFIAQ